MFDHGSLFVVLSVITALATYINYKFIKLIRPLGLVVVSIFICITIVMLAKVNPEKFSKIYQILNGTDFKEIVLDGMLGYLLFASAMHFNYSKCKSYFSSILSLSTIGVLVSTFMVANISWIIANSILGINISYLVCLLIGAIISPTDPVTLFEVLKSNKNMPEKIKILLEGESLFNDVVSIVLFTMFVGIIYGNSQDVSIFSISELLLREGLGGILLGSVIGYASSFLMKSLDDSNALVLMSLAVVSFGFSIAHILVVSAPLVMVVAGLIISNGSLESRLSDKSLKEFNGFWSSIEEILNSFLFVLIGLKVLAIQDYRVFIVYSLIGIIVVTPARYISVVVSLFLVERNVKQLFSKDTYVMTWAGLRGGVSIALALSLPEDSSSMFIFLVIYVYVITSILIKGISLKRILNFCYK
ncbi:cation:proton antiporter [Francisella philomiragia]|uniref:cation:proton antiporter n=2 Tax=Francisella philomiragia TaxID=28110 RepID=UPI0019072880|nr:sodium:proton antiporter [Francisella philomiragia]MBK2093442.1 sodium:proton antiporter [Francisella philomiragia]MBK2106536.1 sodium:proton antiporter [Francisella philomiragia]MBK2255912.1 sodium:proton antiporter [Francisella philomiragia]MBK2268570.1 sodium:proton antiporter [Francisella philomiragia]MBK2270955.1 sodium:proton antiporter [Francisella philomiragia]